MLDGPDRAEVLHVVGEEIGAEAAAQGEPGKETQVGVRVEPDVVEVGVEVCLGQIRGPGGCLDPLLEARGDVMAREVPELDLLLQIEPLAGQSGRTAGAERGLLDLQVDQVSALGVRPLVRLLDVEEKPGEVFPEPERAIDREHLVRERNAVGARLHRGSDRVSRRIFTLEEVVGVVEPDPAGGEVVLAQYARRMEARRVRLGGDPVQAGAVPGFVLRHGRCAVSVAVLTVSVGLVELRGSERPRGGTGRPIRDERAPGAIASIGDLREKAALGETEMEFGAAGNRVIALPWIERTFEDAQRLHELGDDEVRVRISVAVEVAALVDGNAVDGELHVLALARIEAAEEDLLRMPFAAFIGEQDSRRELEELRRVAARDLGELRRFDLEVRGAAGRHVPTSRGGHLDHLLATVGPPADALLRGSSFRTFGCGRLGHIGNRRRDPTIQAADDGCRNSGIFSNRDGRRCRSTVEAARSARGCGRDEEKRDPDAAGHRHVAAQGGPELPAADRIEHGSVERGATGFDDLRVRHRPVRRHRHPDHDLDLASRAEPLGRKRGVDLLLDGGRTHVLRGLREGPQRHCTQGDDEGDGDPARREDTFVPDKRQECDSRVLGSERRCAPR